MFLKNIKIKIVSALAITMAAATAGSAQANPQPSPPKLPRPEVVGLPRPHRELPRRSSETTERSIKADAAINVSLCVNEGDLKVNGWNRKEVRVFVSDGSKFDFKVQQKSPKSGDPVWIMVSAEADPKNKYPSANECIYGSEIEIDAPIGSTLNVKGREISTAVDGIRRVSIKNAGGDISVRNVSDGVTAGTYNGDLTVEQSGGGMSLETTRGNILVSNAWPSEIGDILKAKTTSGAIVVQKIDHRQLEVNSISGTVVYEGEILSGAAYTFWTSNGSIRLSVPSTSSCQLSASYGGSFSSDLPLKIVTEDNRSGPVKNIVADIGTGAGRATLRITTNNGSIAIKKQL